MIQVDRDSSRNGGELVAEALKVLFPIFCCLNDVDIFGVSVNSSNKSTRHMSRDSLTV